MALDQPRALYGVHSITAYKRADHLPYGQMARVIGGFGLAISGDINELMGGSSRYPWASEESAFNVEGNFKLKEFPDWVFEVFLGVAPTARSAEATGGVVALLNAKGTSVFKATTGIATATVKAGSETDLKFGAYVVVAVSATTVDVYLLSDVDAFRGTDLSLTNAHKITSSALTIATSTAVTVPNTGIELTGGSGVIAMTTGDSAYYRSRPINNKSMTVVIGKMADEFPEFGALMLGQKRSNGEMVEIDAYRCKSAGLPMNGAEKAWWESEIKMKALYDDTLDGVFEVNHVSPTTI